MKKIDTSLYTSICLGDETAALTLQQINNYHTLTAEQEKALFRRAATGDMNAENEIAKGNLRYVVSVAKKYQGCGLDFSELFELGQLGLAMAIKRFDVEKGFRFITYATHYIQGAICDYLDMHFARSEKLPKCSLDDYLAEDFTREDCQCGDESADDHLMLVSQRQQISRMMRQYLTPSQAYVLRHYFGLGCVPMQLKEIAAVRHLSYQRIQQIYHAAIARLQENSELLKYVA